MLKRVKWALLPIIILALADLLSRPLRGESFGRGMDLVLEWVVTSAIVWMLTLFALIEISYRYWKTRDLRKTYSEYKAWFYIVALGMVYPIVAGYIIRLKN